MHMLFVKTEELCDLWPHLEANTQTAYIYTPLNSILTYFFHLNNASTYLRYLTFVIYTSPLPQNILNFSLHSIYMTFICVILQM